MIHDQRSGREVPALLKAILNDAGIEVLPRLPSAAPGRTASPNCSYAPPEPKLTDRLLIFGERYARTLLTEYIRYYKGRRAHRAHELRQLRPNHPVADLDHEQIKRRRVLGGLINEYERAA